MKSQKLSIYLIKDNITNHSDIVKDVNTKEIFDNGVLYYKESSSKEPLWTDNFFNKSIEHLMNSTSSGLYITKTEYNDKDIYFGLSFGYGWQMFKDGVIVEQFGIKTALSIIKSDIKKIEKKNFKNGLKDVSEQLGKIGTVADFGFDIEQDIMRALVGEPENQELYGKNVVGKDAISISIKKNVDEVNDILLELYKAYISNKYKENFDWFDNFSAVKDKTLETVLDNKITAKINDDSKTDVIYWLAIPEVIEWENTKCFKYSTRNNAKEYQDIVFEDFKDSLNDDEKTNITADLLKSKKVRQIDTNDQSLKEWSIYKCLYAEIDSSSEKYLLVAGKYYKVDATYKNKIESEYIIDTTFTLPDWDKNEHENDYNKKVATADNTYQCLDGGVSQNNLIGKGKIEFADLVKSDKHLVHVKKYGSSAVLSHLFSQGLVSADLLLTDQSFRKEVNAKLDNFHKNVVSESDPSPKDYTIVYAIGTSKNDLKLPFFSIINYRNIKRQLKLYQFNVLLVKINQI
ncbi:MAG: TIGR04141 family sporadically distributed protein [Chloroherpetonaceae bacterium]